ncbi:short-chain dehydrogenase/reductase SDR [Tribonema minus]|uniref:Short-chain dehydrogenase/reductase SDR n=1 Tax=Tribonema minus TaxID=303371 RepID=A0A835ZEX2_9STRA|nr:short-chain dehydrogenase/reductase SDR [Tribonema minus]
MSTSTDQFTRADPSAGEPGAAPTSLKYPGLSKDMETKPDYGEDTYRGTDRLKGKRAVITGGDSGIGRATALAFAREGADVLISYLEVEEEDAKETERLVKDAGRKIVKVPGDIRSIEHCEKIISTAVKEMGGIDILFNNAGFQMPQETLMDISPEQFDRTMKTNIYAPFWLSRAAIPHMKPGATIINTASVFGFQSPPLLVDYATSKAAVVNFTKALGQQLISKGIRVNAIAPGPINTPMNPATMPDENIEKLGAESPIQRPGQPREMSPVVVFLASQESSYITSEVIGATGGMLIS